MTTVIECRPPVGAKKPAVDLNAIKTKQQAAWSSGDYAIIGTTLQIVGERLAEAMDLRAGQTVLDVAAGNGNMTLAAARRWCEVTSTDYVESLLEFGRKRAEAERLQVKFQIADAEDLPFAGASFDAVVSTFGGMFSPDQDRTAAEMMRVCRSGGQIGLANWTPEGFIGQMFKTIGKYLPPPTGVEVAGNLGYAGVGANDVRRRGVLHNSSAAPIHLPLPLGAALPRYLPDLLWTYAQGI